jgi:hypothetical protein
MYRRGYPFFGLVRCVIYRHGDVCTLSHLPFVTNTSGDYAPPIEAFFASVSDSNSLDSLSLPIHFKQSRVERMGPFRDRPLWFLKHHPISLALERGRLAIACLCDRFVFHGQPHSSITCVSAPVPPFQA